MLKRVMAESESALIQPAVLFPTDVLCRIVSQN